MKIKKYKTINSIKKYLKKDNNLKKYKKLFKNKQIRFLFTKISVIFDSSISQKHLANIELSLLYNPTKENFVLLLERLSKTFDNKFHKLKWESLAVCFWYAFQNSLFYNKNKKIDCEYTFDNFIELNNIKRDAFSKWLKSFYNLKNIDFNNYVVQVLENII